jgi:hypothetical protein
MSSIADIRRDYQLQSLLENDIQKNPIHQPRLQCDSHVW